jgi:peptidylprolyl isomerase
MKRLLVMIAGAIAMVAAMGAAGAQEKENMLYLELKDGRVVIELLPDLAPNHVDRIKELARKKFYDDATVLEFKVKHVLPVLRHGGAGRRN